MKKLIAVLAVSVVVFLFGGIASAQEVIFYIPEVPAGQVITIDAAGTDWAWFDEAYAIQLENTDDSGNKARPTAADWDITEYMAWEAPNWLYMYCTIFDDVYSNTATSNGAMWLGDCHEFVIDGDLSGGDYRTLPEGSDGKTAQQYGIWICIEGDPVVRGNAGMSVSSMWCEDELQWAGGPPWLVAAVDPVVPPQDETDVTVIYEVKVSVWDELLPEPVANSTPHLFAAGDQFGFTWMWDDDDGTGRENNMGLLGPAGDAWTDADLCAVFECVGEDSVEPSTWGSVKALFK